MTASIVAAADDNLALHFSYVQRHTAGMHARVDAELVLVDSCLPSDTFNSMCRARFSDAKGPDGVVDALGYFADVGRPFSWWTGPADQPTTLPDLLLEHGLEAAEAELAMSVEIARLRRGTVPSGLEVVRVRTDAELASFAAICAANWDPPDQGVIDFYRLAAPALLAPRSPLRFYLGLIDGTPVATAEMTVGGGVAGLYNICTMKEFRGRGIGTWLTTHPLLEAGSEGVGTAILQAAPDGVGIYRGLGFTPFGEYVEYKPPVTA